MCPGIIAGEGRKFDGFGAGESWRLGLGADRGLLPRGIPGLGAAPPRGRGRGPPGRSSEDRIPCWGAKGLLPGRGAPGRGAGRGAGRGVAAPFGLNGLLPGRGAGFFPEPPAFRVWGLPQDAESARPASVWIGTAWEPREPGMPAPLTSARSAQCSVPQWWSSSGLAWWPASSPEQMAWRPAFWARASGQA